VYNNLSVIANYDKTTYHASFDGKNRLHETQKQNYAEIEIISYIYIHTIHRGSEMCNGVIAASAQHADGS